MNADRQSGARPDRPRVSVIILTLDRAEYLRRMLRSLEGQSCDPFEVVIVRGPCRDQTQAVLREFEGRIKVVTTTQRNICHSRNLGLAAAAGEIVVYFDDDAEPASPNWLRDLVAPVIRNEADAVGGGVKRSATGEWEFIYNWTSVYGAQARTTDAAPPPGRPGVWQVNVPGGNGAWRRSLLAGIGGFDETFVRYLDESDACRRAERAGGRILITPDNFVWHHRAPGPHRASRPDYRLDIDVRSQVYFALRNAPDACGVRLAKAVLISVRMLLSVVLHHLERPKNVPRLIPLWMWGVAAGFARAVFFGRRLARFGEPMAPFVPFRRCLRQDS